MAERFVERDYDRYASGDQDISTYARVRAQQIARRRGAAVRSSVRPDTNSGVETRAMLVAALMAFGLMFCGFLGHM